MRRVAVVVPLLVSLLVLLAGCGAGAAGNAGSTAGMADSGGSAAKAALPAARPGQPVAAKTKPIAVPRSVIRTAAMTVRVPDVRKATAAAERLAANAGGEVTDEKLDLQADQPSAALELRVPPARLGATLSDLSDLGDEQSRRLGTDDVTDQVVDLDSRLATQRSSVARVRALLDRAGNLSDVVRIEAELSRREGDLESLQARVRALSGQVTMSKITLTLISEDAKPKVAAAVGFTSGLRGGWHAFLTAARVAAATIGALLPFLPIIGLALWGALWWRRRTSAA